MEKKKQLAQVYIVSKKNCKSYSNGKSKLHATISLSFSLFSKLVLNAT